MTPDFDALRRPHDLIVVGGGIHGLFAAYDAASRGLSVALVEKNDFGSGLSANHQRTIHGGLRSLERGHVAKARRLIHERRTWARIAPHLLRPLPFLIGTYRWTTRSRLALRSGFAAYELIGRSRNAGVSQELHLPRTRLESAAATRRLFPGIRAQGLTGGAIWYDYQTIHPDRLAWTVALAARHAGAKLFNYVEAIGPLRSNGRIAGLSLKATLTGEIIEAPASVTLVAAGSNLSALLGQLGASGAPPLVRAMNLLLNRPARDIALAAPGGAGRMLTAVPWQRHILVGTFQSTEAVAPAAGPPPANFIDAALADANVAFPALRAARADLRLIHHGLTPAEARGSTFDLQSEPRVLKHAVNGLAGLVTLIGVKFTSARSAAEAAVDVVCADLQRRGRSQTAWAELPHAGVADVEGRLLEGLRDAQIALDPEVVGHLAGWYGTEAPSVAQFAAEQGLLARLSPESPVLAGEIAYAVEAGDARRLSDVVFRRTCLGSGGNPGRAALEAAADVMSTRLGWSPDRRAAEIADVVAVYPATTAGC